MNQKTQKRSVNFPSETLKTLDKLAAREHTTTSELIRNFVEEGLKVNGYEEQVDFIARIIRQEITAVYHVEDIKAISDHSTDRLAKMLMKTGKINAAMLKVLIHLADRRSLEEMEHMVSEAVVLGVDYMQKKDFQINSFLYDTDYLMHLAEKL